MPTALIPLVLAIAWGLNWPAVKIILSVLPPFAARGIGLGAGVVLLIALALLRGAALWPQRAAWPAIAVGGLLTVAVFNICTAFAQLTTSTSRAAVLTFTMPLMSAVLAWLLLGERPGRRGAWALALGGAGVLVLAAPVLQGLLGATPPGPAGAVAPVAVTAVTAVTAATATATAAASATPTGSAWGLLFPLVAALAWSVATVATKRWPPPGDRIVITAWQLGIGATLALLIALGVGERLPTVWPLRVQVALAWHVVISTALAYVLWYRLLASASATVSSLTTLAVPVVGVLGAMALVGDSPSGADWLGFGLVLGGATLAMVNIGR